MTPTRFRVLWAVAVVLFALLAVVTTGRMIDGKVNWADVSLVAGGTWQLWRYRHVALGQAKDELVGQRKGMNLEDREGPCPRDH
jgi:hypothetical protein